MSRRAERGRKQGLCAQLAGRVQCTAPRVEVGHTPRHRHGPSGERAPVQGDIRNTGDCHSLGKIQAWGTDGLRGQSGFGGLIASSMVRGATDPSSRRRSRRKDATRKQRGVWIVGPLKISSRTPRLVGGKPNWGRESMKLKKRHCFMTSTPTCPPPRSYNYWESRYSVL